MGHGHFLYSTGRLEHFLKLTCKIGTPRQGPLVRKARPGVTGNLYTIITENRGFVLNELT